MQNGLCVVGPGWEQRCAMQSTCQLCPAAGAWRWELVPPSLRASQLLSTSLRRSYFANPLRYLDKLHLDLLSTHPVCSAAAGHGLLGAAGGGCPCAWPCGSAPAPALHGCFFQLRSSRWNCKIRALSLVCSCSAACVASSNFLLECASRHPGGNGFIWLLPLPRH